MSYNTSSDSKVSVEKGIKKVLFREIPAVDQLLGSPRIRKTLSHTPRALVLRAIHEVLDEIRLTIANASVVDELFDLSSNTVIDRILERISTLCKPSLRHVINATGVIVHTNLGRSLLSKSVIRRLSDLAGCYSNLEYDLYAGTRGSRYVHVEDILKELTGADAAMVVNNNAAAVLIALNTLAKDKEVVIARSELVEIGGSFRIPEVMRKSGALMFEVGTTNKTTVKDYEAAIDARTALLLKVHKSNFQIVGFSEEVDLAELVLLGKKRGLPVMEDLGSGCLIDFSKYGLKGEPTVQDSIAKGADIVTFSGDKMLGGPQCGIILGKKEIISAIRQNQLARALRVDKLTILSLQETLHLYRDKKSAIRHIPTLRMICESYAHVYRKAKKLLEMVGRLGRGAISIDLRDGVSRVGGGAMPLEEIKSCLISVSSKTYTASKIERFFRSFDPPIIIRVEKNIALLDMRTIQEKELRTVAKAIRELSQLKKQSTVQK
jgi:L-seryl-tRNA(Ser) seleniumtransferase